MTAIDDTDIHLGMKRGGSCARAAPWRSVHGLRIAVPSFMQRR
jgi:hypothetical protein